MLAPGYAGRDRHDTNASKAKVWRTHATHSQRPTQSPASNCLVCPERGSPHGVVQQGLVAKAAPLRTLVLHSRAVRPRRRCMHVDLRQDGDQGRTETRGGDGGGLQLLEAIVKDRGRRVRVAHTRDPNIACGCTVGNGWFGGVVASHDDLRMIAELARATWPAHHLLSSGGDSEMSIVLALRKHSRKCKGKGSDCNYTPQSYKTDMHPREAGRCGSESAIYLGSLRRSYPAAVRLFDRDPYRDGFAGSRNASRWRAADLDWFLEFRASLLYEGVPNRADLAGELANEAASLKGRIVVEMPSTGVDAEVDTPFAVWRGVASRPAPGRGSRVQDPRGLHGWTKILEHRRMGRVSCKSEVQ
ncbi:hypothetical protein G7046_g4454 [Stylonectria norvegica]|nr:hypothetical protein G7046_g4454 [Stylonectria norvegica]